MIDESIMTTLEQSTLKLWKWMKSYNFASYDHYDLLGTPYGVAAKALMQTNGVIGALAVSPIMLLDMFFPSVRRYFEQPKTTIWHLSGASAFGFGKWYRHTQNAQRTPRT